MSIISKQEREVLMFFEKGTCLIRNETSINRVKITPRYEESGLTYDEVYSAALRLKTLGMLREGMRYDDFRKCVKTFKVTSLGRSMLNLDNPITFWEKLLFWFGI